MSSCGICSVGGDIALFRRFYACGSVCSRGYAGVRVAVRVMVYGVYDCGQGRRRNIYGVGSMLGIDMPCPVNWRILAYGDAGTRMGLCPMVSCICYSSVYYRTQTIRLQDAQGYSRMDDCVHGSDGRSGMAVNECVHVVCRSGVGGDVCAERAYVAALIAGFFSCFVFGIS